jgi:hypothetical protein
LRRDQLSPGSASFTAVLELQTPRRIMVTARGPMILGEDAMSVSATQWVLPGKSITGDGWILELPGFMVQLAEPLPASVSLSGGEATIPIRARITMQCACDLEPDGIWDPANFEIGAMLEKDGRTYPATALEYAGEPSTFNGTIAVTEPGEYTVDLYAYDPATGNTGVLQVPLSVR